MRIHQGWFDIREFLGLSAVFISDMMLYLPEFQHF
jgi:hypothetical protein